MQKGSSGRPGSELEIGTYPLAKASALQIHNALAPTSVFGTYLLAKASAFQIHNAPVSTRREFLLLPFVCESQSTTVWT